jgi:hypothetical protein
VARSEYDFTDEHIQKRLSFGESYVKNDASFWNSVLFSDEKHFGIGMNQMH